MDPMQALNFIVTQLKNATLFARPDGTVGGMTFGDHANVAQAELVLVEFIKAHTPKQEDIPNGMAKGQTEKTASSKTGKRRHGR